MNRIIAWGLGCLAALVMAGCAAPNYGAQCVALYPNSLEALSCTQERYRADPRTTPELLAKIDFMVGAWRHLHQRVASSQITRDEARETITAIGKDLEVSNYVSLDLIERCGMPLDSPYLAGIIRARPTSNPVASGTSSAPCVTSYCGPVNVRGYYRKDGTYVRPHTRSAPGSGRSSGRGR